MTGYNIIILLFYYECKYGENFSRAKVTFNKQWFTSLLAVHTDEDIDNDKTTKASFEAIKEISDI